MVKTSVYNPCACSSTCHCRPSLPPTSVPCCPSPTTQNSCPSSLKSVSTTMYHEGMGKSWTSGLPLLQLPFGLPFLSILYFHFINFALCGISMFSTLAVFIKHPNFYAPRKISGEHIVATLSVRPSVRQSVSPSVRPIRVRPITLLFEVGF